MATLLPRDDLNHEWLPDSLWRESYYFAFFDERLGIGSFHTMGERPVKNHSGLVLAFWGRETLTLVNWDEVHRTDTTHRCKGLEYVCEEPLHRWRMRFEGQAYRVPGEELRVPRELVDVHPPSNVPAVPVTFDMQFTGSHEAYGFEGGGAWASVFTGHIEQAGRVRGHLRIGENKYEVDGHGFRDRSWGRRDWVGAREWLFVVAQVAVDCAVSLWQATFNGRTLVDGFVTRGGRNHRVVALEPHVEYREAAEMSLPTTVKFDIADDSGEHLELTGEVVRTLPILLKAGRKDQPGLNAWVDRSLVRFRLPNGRQAHGEFEQLRPIVL